MSTTDYPKISLTDAAVAKVSTLLAGTGDPALALRVAVRPGGCSGFSYEMFFDSCAHDDDVRREFPAEPAPVLVLVDPSSASLLHGATLDYHDGLDKSGFSIDNPNASRTCGCGNSFS